MGFIINFKEGYLQVPSEKLKTVRKELGEMVTKTHMSCRKMAAILGTVRIFLTALPFLRAFTDQHRAFVQKAQGGVGQVTPNTPTTSRRGKAAQTFNVRVARKRISTQSKYKTAAFRLLHLWLGWDRPHRGGRG